MGGGDGGGLRYPLESLARVDLCIREVRSSMDPTLQVHQPRLPETDMCGQLHGYPLDPNNGLFLHIRITK